MAWFATPRPPRVSFKLIRILIGHFFELGFVEKLAEQTMAVRDLGPSIPRRITPPTSTTQMVNSYEIPFMTY
jgi:hypothetical protein